MATEIQDFLDYIKSMGIEAWIPDTPGHGPKMSVSDQCQSKILCLEYEGTDVYIQGNPCLTKNTKIHKNNKPAVGLKNNMADGSKADTNDAYYKTCNEIPQKCNLVDSGNLTEKCGCNLEIKTLPVRIPEEHLNCSAKCLIRLRRNINNINSQLNGMIENGKFSPDIGGRQFKRIVSEKLTREVRVAKCYVSSLPSMPDNTGGEDYENPIKVKPLKPKRGFVQQLIKLFNADNLIGTKYNEQ